MTEELQTLTDILGNDLAIGDTVVYPQMSGRSVQMVVGTFQGYNGKTAKVLRQEGSRWTASYTPRPRYRDSRTGKGIDPYAGDGKHIKVPSYTEYVNAETGERLSYAEYKELTGFEWTRPPWKYSYVRDVFHDYVEEYTPEPKPVTIQNVSNIVKVVVNG